MKIQYETIALRTQALDIIAKANAIIEEYQKQGYQLTLRQLYYQFVARDLFPEKWADPATGSRNSQKNYDKLGNIISSGRRAGLVDWDAIVDRTRFLREPSTWSSPSAIIEAVARQFKCDLWAEQAKYVEIWFEKDALLGTFERSAGDYRLPIFSNRGYVSDSSIWEAAQRIQRHEDKECVILHFGDHDPSGIDMTRDVGDRLALFGATVEIKRLALNMNQVKKYNPPPNPAKETDSRFAEYVANFGDKSWELDALPPDVLVKLVQSEVGKHLDLTAWEDALDSEAVARKNLKAVADCDWYKLTKLIDKNAKKLRKIP